MNEPRALTEAMLIAASEAMVARGAKRPTRIFVNEFMAAQLDGTLVEVWRRGAYARYRYGRHNEIRRVRRMHSEPRGGGNRAWKRAGHVFYIGDDFMSRGYYHPMMLTNDREQWAKVAKSSPVKYRGVPA